MIRVLLVDDERQLVKAFEKQLTEDGLKIIPAFSAARALEHLKKESFDVAVLDIKLPDLDGVDLLLQVKQMEPTTEVIMLTGFASVETAIRSIRLGAYDYLTKPCKISELHKIILKAYENKTLKEKNIVLEEQLHRIGAPDEFIGESKQMGKVKKLISMVANSQTPVLICGETGTGKELAARAIHEKSARAQGPFFTINSSTLQETMLESELFGYKKGAFTGAQDNKLGLLEIAHKGTFFIDEVGDMGSSIQAKILRVLETGSFVKLGDTKETRVDVRFIFATNKDLSKEVEAGRFRKDLFFRMNAFVISLPPLRDKTQDIPTLADYFLRKFTKGWRKKYLSPEATQLLVCYKWPGNVRELANVMERAVLLSGDRPEIIPDDFLEGMLPSPVPASSTEPHRSKKQFKLSRLEEEHVEKVLTLAKGNKSEAARLLGISRKTLYKKMGKDLKQ
jgi:DNA-binding NtrC family response regulator